LEVNRKASAEARGKLFIENLSRENFCEILDRLALMFRFELINIREGFDGYWEKTIVNGKTAWRKDDRVLLSQFLFPFKKEVFDAIEGEIGVYHKDKINWQTIRKILFNGEKIQILTSRKSEIALILTKETLEELYFKQNKSLEDIAKKYGTSRQNVMKIMKKYGLIRRTQSKARIEAIKKGKFETFEYHEINEKFFSKWSPEMAWVLGLLFTDGSIDKTRVVIYSIDLDLLEKIQKLLNSSNLIAKRPQSYDKAKHIYEFGFYRENMRGDLNKLGLQERKSLNMIFPDIPEEYMRHFIRGCWDGDGSIFFDRGKLVASYVTGSKNFIEKLVHELFKIGIFKNTKPYHLDHKGIGYRSVKKYLPMTDEFWSKYPDGKFPMTIHMKNINAYYIKIQTRENVEKLFHYFYDGVDESMYLTRKYNVFLKGLRLEEKNETKQLTLVLDF